MKPRKISVNELVKILMYEHEESKHRLSEFEKLSKTGNYDAARELINNLKTNYEQHMIDEEAVLLGDAIKFSSRENCKDIIEILQQHRPIMNMVQRIIDSVDDFQLTRIDELLQALRKILEIHYSREEVEVFPRILKHHEQNKS